MEENKVIPNTEEVKDAGEDTIPNESPLSDNSTVSVKFNKKTRDLSLEEAKNLAQKGLKYELISEDFERLKNMAQESGNSVSDFLSVLEQKNAQKHKQELIKETGGNEKLADYIIELEEKQKNTDGGFTELKAMFPEINQIGELPTEVTDYAKVTGKNLLDSYLRYLAKENRSKEAVRQQQKAARESGIGSLKSSAEGMESAANHEFAKGLWGK